MIAKKLYGFDSHCEREYNYSHARMQFEQERRSRVHEHPARLTATQPYRTMARNNFNEVIKKAPRARIVLNERGRSERGRRINESHPRALLTDHEIDLIRELHADGLDRQGRVIRKGLSYRQIAEKFEEIVARMQIRHIVR